MKNIFDLITRDDIYNILIPVGISFLGFIYQRVSKLFDQEKQWRHLGEKSSRDEMFDYFIWMLFIGIIVLVIYFLGALCVGIIFSINEFNAIAIKITYTIFSLFMYISFFLNHQKKKVTFKKKYKNEKVYADIIIKMPIVISGIMWSFVFWNGIESIWRLAEIIAIGFGLAILIFLDDNRDFKYKQVTFYFYGGKILRNLDVNSIRQEKNWVIVKTKDSNVEYRFRIKDMETIEYKK